MTSLDIDRLARTGARMSGVNPDAPPPIPEDVEDVLRRIRLRVAHMPPLRQQTAVIAMAAQVFPPANGNAARADAPPADPAATDDTREPETEPERAAPADSSPTAGPAARPDGDPTLIAALTARIEELVATNTRLVESLTVRDTDISSVARLL